MRGDLQEGDAPAVLGMMLKQMLVGENALGQALGVVQAVDPQEQAPAIQANEQASPSLVAHLRRRLGEAVGIDGNGKAAGAQTAAKALDALFIQYLAAGLEAQIVQEGPQVSAGLQTDQVAVAEPFHQFAVVRQGGEGLGGREGSVQEKADGVVYAALAQLLRHQEQVIVVDPDQVAGANLLRKLFGEEFVDPAIGFEMRAVILHQVGAVVENRPEHAVGIAVVVALEFGLGQVNGGDLVMLFFLRVEPAFRVTLCNAATPAEPEA